MDENQINQEDERGMIPNLIKIGAMPSDMNIEVDTDVLEPVVSSQSFARFVLEKKGFMNSFSKITLGLQLNANASHGIFPANIGIHSLISKCALKCGTTTISEFSDWNYWMGYKSMFIDNEINLERETFLTSRLINHDFVYKSDLNNQSNTNASAYGLQSHRYSDTLGYDGFDATDFDVKAPEYIMHGNTPLFQISLADLFPFLRFNQLPLYMFDEQISIELHFTSPATKFRSCLNGSETASTGTTFNVDLTELKLISDYLYYDHDLMNRFRDANKVMNFNYVDYRLNKRSLTQAQAQVKQIMNVGGAGRIVNKVVGGLFNDNKVNPDCSILNVYGALAPNMNGNNNTNLTTNLRYNDTYLYPIDVDSPAIQFNQVIRGEGTIPYVTREEYSRQGAGTITPTEFQGYSQSSASGIKGHFFWNVYKLNKNERVNSRGIEVETSYGAVSNATHTYRAWVELVKTAKLENGLLTCYFA